MFAVIQYHEHVAAANKAHQRIHRRPAGLVGQSKRARYRYRHHRRMSDRRQIDIPNTITELRRDANRDLNSETRLAGAAGSGQGHQPVIAQQPAHIIDLCVASNKTCELDWKIVHSNTFRCTQWWEISTEIRMAQLHHSLGTRKITQRVS